mgnify:CR=1 FL=1
MSRILPLGEKAALAVGVGNSTTVGNATVVRVLSTGGAAVVVRTDSSGAIIGSFTTLNNSAELVEKNAFFIGCHPFITDNEMTWRG